jgi:flagellin
MTNFGSLSASTSLSRSGRALGVASDRLSTGLRINSAKDDAAGLAISQGMTASIRGLNVAVRNANDGLSLAQTAEASLLETSQMVQRMRELAVQSANGTMSTENRFALQAEFDQLLSEVDKISKTTNFNDIKLLDGSSQAAILQTGDKAGNSFAVALSKADSRSLGLRGFAPEGQLTSGRVANPAGISYNAILINGKNWTTSVGASALSSIDAASTISSAINANIGEHNVLASAYNLIRGEAPTASSFATGDLVINGSAVGHADSVENLVTNINRDVGGVIAYLNPDNTISLSNDTGRQITLTGTNPSKAGFSSGSTYQGFVTLNRLDFKEIKVEPANRALGFPNDIGFVSDLQKIGFNAATGAALLSGKSVSSDIPTENDRVFINGVRIEQPKAFSASSKEAAINAVSNVTGVIAKAKTSVEVALDFTYRPQAPVKQVTTYAVHPGTDDDDKFEITINGYKLTINANDSGVGLDNIKSSILGEQLKTSLTGVTGSQSRASALAFGLASLINQDVTMAGLVKAEGLSDGTLKITSNVQGQEIVSDLKVTPKPGIPGRVIPPFTGTTLPTPPSGALTAWSEGPLTGTTLNVDFQNAGTGLGETGGFSGRSQYISFGVGGVGSGGTRRIVFNALDWRDQEAISFDAIRGSDFNGGEETDFGEDLKFYYSTDGGNTRNLFYTLAYNSPYTNWTSLTVNLPVAAKTASTTFIMEQVTSGPVYDHYALHNLTFQNAALAPGTGVDDEMIWRGQTIQGNVFNDTQSFKINGKSIDITSAKNIYDLVSVINANAPSGVIAYADKSGKLILESASGENISVENLSKQDGKFVQSVRTLTGEAALPEASFKFGGSIEADDVAVITINGEKVVVQSTTTDAGTVASRVAAAINAHGVLRNQVIASSSADGKVNLVGMGSIAGLPIALRTEFLEANSFFAGDIGKGGGVDQITYDGTIPDNGQTVTVLSNGITSLGSITLESMTGGEIRIEDGNNGISAAKYGLSLQGERMDLIGGTINILTQTNSGIAMRAIDAAIDKLNLRMGDLGAVQNKLEAKIGILTSTNVNMEAARSRILDTDYATETTNLTRAQVIQQAATAMLAQANGQAQTVLSLLK